MVSSVLTTRRVPSPGIITLSCRHALRWYPLDHSTPDGASSWRLVKSLEHEASQAKKDPGPPSPKPRACISCRLTSLAQICGSAVIVALKKKPTTRKGTQFLSYDAAVLVLLATTAKSADGKETSVVLEPLVPDTTEKSAWGEEDAVGVGENAEPWALDVEVLGVVVEFGRGLDVEVGIGGVVVGFVVELVVEEGVLDVVLELIRMLTPEVSIVLEFATVLIVEVGVVSMTLELDGALINVVGDTALVSEVAEVTVFDVEILDVFLKLTAMLEVVSELALALVLEVEIVCAVVGLARVLFANV